MKKRVVIAGFGDTGLLVAIHLGSQFDVVGISPKPCLVSGQELGARLTRPSVWQQDYLMPFSRYKKLDGVKTLQGLISHIDTENNTVTVNLENNADASHEDGPSQNSPSQEGALRQEIVPYDVLLIASGVSNGFWRNNTIENHSAIKQKIQAEANQIEQAKSIAVVGGGATGVSVSANIAETYPDKDVHYYFSQSQPLPGYHSKVRQKIVTQLQNLNVRLHPNHRAVIPEGERLDRMSSSKVEWQAGQAPSQADLTLWAVGSTRPNSAFIPESMLNEDGYVKINQQLRVPEFNNIFAVGDIAASDVNRSSARNWGYRIAANNIRCYLEQRDEDMQSFEAPEYRWGSLMGLQKNGLRVFQADGGSFRFPKWVVRTLLFPLAVHRAIYRGVRSSS